MCLIGESAETVGEQHGEQSFHDIAGAAILACADDHTRDHIHFGLLNGFREAVEYLLGDLELRSAICTDLFLCGKGLRDTDPCDLLSFRLGQRALEFAQGDIGVLRDDLKQKGLAGAELAPTRRASTLRGR